MDSSCSLPALFGPFTVAQFRHEGANHPLALSLAVRYLPHMLMREAQSPCDDCNSAPHQRGLSEFDAYPCKIHGGYQLSENESYAEPRMYVNQKTRLRVNAEDRPAIAAEMRGARARLGLSQKALAERLGSSQGAITRWERGKDSPPISALLAMADLVEDDQKFFWLKAAGIPRVVLGGAEPPTLGEGGILSAKSTTMGVFARRPTETRIGLLKNPLILGDREALNTANIDVSLTFPSAWFPKDSDIQAAKMTGIKFPFFEGDIIALVDISRTDPDRLLGSTVAVRTPDGVEPRVLRKDGATYLLVPIQHDDDRQFKIFRRNGDLTIVGRIVKWIADAPTGRK